MLTTPDLQLVSAEFVDCHGRRKTPMSISPALLQRTDNQNIVGVSHEGASSRAYRTPVALFLTL